MYIKIQTVLEFFLLWNLFYHANSIQRHKSKFFKFYKSSRVTGWNYQDLCSWGRVCNKGKSQSPVDLASHVIGMQDDRPPLELLHTDTELRNVSFVNNGHTVQFTGIAEKCHAPGITGPHVLSEEKYKFVNAHLHWNTDNNNGTEHAIKGNKYATELHLVHMNQKYESVGEALKHEDGLAVIGILYKVDDDQPPNPGIEKFIHLAQNVQEPQQECNVESFCLDSFYSDEIPSFYSYKGSLTTPPCTENVRWIVAADPHPISSELINELRKIKFSRGYHNIRPLQKINDRLIEFYKQPDTNTCDM